MAKQLKVSIVTPNFNQASCLERTIVSVLNQGYDNLEYIVIDGGSTDGSIEIIQKYEGRLKYWVSEKDRGMYDAINKGFAHSTGDIMGWLNSDDILLPDALNTIESAFNTFPEIDWVTGMPVTIDERDRIIGSSYPYPWSRNRLLSGSFQWIQQESTYWRRDLWNRAGGKIDDAWTLAGDFELWLRFSRYAQLTSVKCALACFRMRSRDQKSLESMEVYISQAKQLIGREVDMESAPSRARIFMIKFLRAFNNSFRIPILSPFTTAIVNKMMHFPDRVEIERKSGHLIKGKSY